MPAPIYLQQQPSFMDQFAPYFSNIMQSIMMGVRNRREDESTARGYIEKGYTETDPLAGTVPVTPTQRAAAPQTPEEMAAFAKGPRGKYWREREPAPDLTVGRGGLMGMPKRGFRKPVEPKGTFGVEPGTGGKDWAVVRKGNKIVTASLIKTKMPKNPDKWEQLPRVTIGGSTLLPQRNKTTKKIEYFRVPPRAKGAAGGGVSVLKNEQTAVIKEINTILAGAKLSPLNLVSLAGMKADERKAFMASFTKDAKSRLKGSARKRYTKLTANLQRITDKLAGIKPLKLTPEITEDYLRRANGNPEEAERMAIEDGYSW